jgi:hypothetical protein
MRKQSVIWMVGTALLLSPAAAQEQAAESRWIEETGERLARFLPDATPEGLTPEQYIFKGGANGTPHKYICVLAHRYWKFDDAELSRQLEENSNQEKALNKEMEDTAGKFMKEHAAEIEANKKRVQALQDQYGDLMKAGKYDQSKALMEKIAELQHQTPLTAVMDSFEKRSEEIAARKKHLSGQWRNVNFRFGTNRTLAASLPNFHLQSSGTLAGRPLYREEKIDRLTSDRVLNTVGLAIFLGPPGYQNPPVKLGQSELAVKCIFVWAWIESRSDTVKADEAIARRILEKVDYKGLSKLIEP